MLNIVFYPHALLILLPSIYLAIFNVNSEDFLYVLTSTFIFFGLPMSIFVQLFFNIVFKKINEERSRYLWYTVLVGAVMGFFYTLAVSLVQAVLSNFRVLFTVSNTFTLQSLREVFLLPVIFDALSSLGIYFVMFFPGIILGVFFGWGLGLFTYQMHENSQYRDFFYKTNAPMWTYYGLLLLIYLSFLYMAVRY
jgi:hypothetical protein